MDRDKMPIFEPGIKALACSNCRSANKLVLQDDQFRCRECSATYRIIDGVLDLMPLGYKGYPGDSMGAAVLRDAHNRQTLREDTARLRSELDQCLPPKALLLDAGCGTGQLTRMISESHPDVTVIAADVSLPMCRLAAKNCRDHPVLVVRTPNSTDPPMPLRDSMFDLVLNRLAPMNPVEAFRLLKPGGYAVKAKYVDVYWQEIRQVFPEERIIRFPKALDRQEALWQVGFRETEAHAWRFTKRRTMEEIIMTLKYAPILREFDETADQPFLVKLEALYGDQEGVRMTEGDSLVIGRKVE
jgi:SAM-dependent methyltransferase